MTSSRALALLAALLLTSALPARAEDFKPDDRVIFDVAAEDWVTTKTARVSLNVDAAVSSNTAGAMRANMTKAVNDLIKADWRLTSFDRGQDQTGLERWSASFEARVPEDQLNGLGENAKKLSKAGMQLTVNSIDFSPTLDEMQATYNKLRAQIYKSVNDELTALNTAMPSRNYRIALINFTGSNEGGPVMMPQVMRGFAKAEMATMGVSSDEAQPQPMERAEKVTQTAHVVFAITPPAPPAIAH